MPTRSERWPAGTPCWVDLSVDDLARSTAFYGSVLGWSFVDSGEEFGHYNIAQVAGKAAAAIGPKMSADQPTAWNLYFASDDVDATAAAITAAGGSVIADPFDIPGTGRMCAAVDPSGAVFSVWQAAGMIGAEIYNEPGGITWEDGRLADPDAARTFYSAVFGFTHGPVPGAPDDYTMFQLDGGPLGGMGGMMGASEGTPSHWVVYFSVADADAAAQIAVDGGGVLEGAMDTPFGRMAFLTDPDGAGFAVAGTMPTT